MAQQLQTELVSMRLWVRSLALLSGLKIQHCRELWYRPQTRLGSHIVVTVAEASSCSSNLIPSLGTFICCRCRLFFFFFKKRFFVSRWVLLLLLFFTIFSPLTFNSMITMCLVFLFFLFFFFIAYVSLGFAEFPEFGNSCL